ncbi:MAG: substrate-binding domain-containing protein [Eubacteriales bacterium]|nr:substrate-binding domain-containing protein [Eubacteriales bacterium]
MKVRKGMAGLLVGAMCAGMLAGCGNLTPINAVKDDAEESVQAYTGDLMLILPKKDEYLSYLDQAAKAYTEARGCTLTTVDCAEDQDKEIEYVEAAVAEDAKVIIIALADNSRAQDVIDAAGDVPVVFVNRAPADLSLMDETHIYVGSNEDESGAYQGKALVEYLESKGKDNINYLMFKGTEGQDSTTKRTAGVLKALEDAGIQANAAAEPVDCDYDRTAAMSAMSVMLADDMDMDDIDVIISNNDAMALGAIEALKQGEVDMADIAIVGVDGTNAGLEAIANGEMLATAYQNAIGQASASVQAAINLAGGTDVMNGISFETDEDNSSVIWVPFELVAADNVEDYR